MVVCNPAIKTKEDQKALIDALKEDRIDIIATDHAPHTKDEKEKEYPDCPSGIPLVQHSLLALLELSSQKDIPIETIVKKTSHAVSDRYGIMDRGYIREGYWAEPRESQMGNPDILFLFRLWYEAHDLLQ